MKEPVTKEQYELYHGLYDQEERTSLQLEGRAKVYLGIVSAFLAAMILKTSDAEATAKKPAYNVGTSVIRSIAHDHGAHAHPLGTQN